MAVTLTCPQGHQWEPEAGGLTPSARQSVCPVCGAQAMPPTDSESVVVQRTVTYRAAEPEASATVSDRPTIPGYEILSELGRGGMGVVYKARHLKLKRLVALKMILAGSHAGLKQLERFRTEAEAVARLQHPNIVQIYEIGDWRTEGVSPPSTPHPYLALEYVDGGSLAAKMDGTPQPPRQAAEIVETLARAMHFAHERGIVHRDLKPANVLIADCGLRIADSQEVARQDRGPSPEPTRQAPGFHQSAIRNPQSAIKITDFGLAKQLDSGEPGGVSPRVTVTGAIMGTPSYMAPEQAAGRIEAISPATDVYALGAILYEALTGRPPFKAATLLETLEQVRSHEPVPPRYLQPKVPRDLETIGLKCLQKEPRKRYLTAQALADDLGCFREGRPISARPVGRIEKTWRWCRRNPVVAGLIAAVVLVLLLGTGTAWYLAVDAIQQKDRADLKSTESDLNANKADAKAKEANEQRQQALASAAETRLEFERFQVANGLRLMEGGDLFGAMLWFARPLDDERGPSQMEELHRYRLTYHWRYASRPTLLQCFFHKEPVHHAEFSPDGRRVVTASGETARVWDAGSGQPRTLSLAHKEMVWHAAFSPDGRRVVTASSDKTARVWDAATGQPLARPLAHQQYVKHAEFSPDGRRVVTASFDKTARVWDAKTGEALTPPLAHQDMVHHAAFSPDSRRVVTASSDKTARVWDAATGQPLTPPLAHQEMVFHAAFSPDSGRVVTGSSDKTARVWDAETGQPLTPPLAHAGWVVHAAFSADGRRLVTASYARTARVWDAETGQPLTPPLVHQSVVYQAAFSPDGRRVVTASWDKTARVWDAATGQPLTPPLPHQDYVGHAAFSPDSRRIVTASNDKTARVWDAAMGQPLSPPLAHQNYVNQAAFSPDGRRVVTASGTAARVWDVSLDERPVTDWVRLTQFLYGHRLDRYGALEPLAMQKRWQELRAKYPQDFTVTPEQALAWHRREAEACLKEKNAPAALFHLFHGSWEWAVLTGLPHL